MRKRRLKSPWPFPVSVDARGVVWLNLPPHEKRPRERKAKPIATTRQQELL